MLALHRERGGERDYIEYGSVRSQNSAYLNSTVTVVMEERGESTSTVLILTANLISHPML